ncbi:MAG TPA: hypothetical protein VLB83_03225 [Candidatus Paceibacterota bacterium]|nr:hypothetical protein [Candidatus Paceibacterota bacterium]
MRNSKEPSRTYDEGAQITMCILYTFASAAVSALAVWIGWIKASHFGAGIGFLIYLAVANAGTLLSLIRKPELFPFFLRASKFRAIGCGIGTFATLTLASGDGFTIFIATISAFAASMIANELTLMSAPKRHMHD